ncbi:MAG: leucine-rich repeat domain-containing protein [Paludibacteraceae bacterium]|nr:leucine-rich repeat domain-containing protein [Paludibacteraceae bacterium]
MKNLFFSLLILCTTAVFADGVKIGELYYNLDADNRTAEVTYQGKGLLNYSELPNGSLDIPASVTYDRVTYDVTAIGDQAFVYCTVLTSVTVPHSVKTIGSDAFFLCSNLAKVNLPSDLSGIGPMAFYRCTSLKSFTVPDSVKVLRGSTFEQCTALTGVTLPDSLKAILDGAFISCTALKRIVLPKGLTAIGKNVFSGDSTLNEIYNNVDSPLVVTSSSFSGVDTLNCILYVPEGSMEAYRSTSVWKDFRDIRPMPETIPDAVEMLRNDSLVEPKKILDNGQLVILLPDGTVYSVTGQKLL